MRFRNYLHIIFIAFFISSCAKVEFSSTRGWCSKQGKSCCLAEKTCGAGCAQVEFSCKNACSGDETLIPVEWEYRGFTQQIREGCWDPDARIATSSVLDDLISRTNFKVLSYPTLGILDSSLALNDLALDPKGNPICREICTDPSTQSLCYGVRAQSQKSFDGLNKIRNKIFNAAAPISIKKDEIKTDLEVNDLPDSCDAADIQVDNQSIKRNSPSKCYIYSSAVSFDGATSEINVIAPKQLKGEIDRTHGAIIAAEKAKFSSLNRSVFETGKGMTVKVLPSGAPRAEEYFSHLNGERPVFEYYKSGANPMSIGAFNTFEVYYLGSPAVDLEEFKKSGCLYILPPN